MSFIWNLVGIVVVVILIGLGIKMKYGEEVLNKIIFEFGDTASLVINGTVKCDNNTAQSAVKNAIKNTEQYKNVELSLNNIEMQKIDNLKTYCGATLETTYGSIPITYTTQKAGFLEVYVEVANVR